MKYYLLLAWFVSGLTLAQISPDYAKESRWATQVEDSLMDGDVVWIKNSDREFLSILTESESESNKVAIVMHGLGVHPDWSGVIQPLRVALTENGYHTLSIQLPVLANGVPGSEYKPLWKDSDKRIQAAIAYVTELGLSVDSLVAHSHGTRMAKHYFENNPQHPFKRFVAIGMGDASGLAHINIPTLDLYGTEDLDSVLGSVSQRKQAAKHNAAYEQIQISGDHFFNDQNEILNKTVINWLN